MIVIEIKVHQQGSNVKILMEGRDVSTCTPQEKIEATDLCGMIIKWQDERARRPDVGKAIFREGGQDHPKNKAE